MKLKRLILICCLPVFAGFCPGTETVFWETASKQDFLRGQCDGTGITAGGRIVLAPDLEVLYQSGETHVWSVIPGPGEAVFAGTGNEGSVIKVSAEGEAETVVDTREFEIFAVAADPAGHLYFASSPDGRIYRSDPGGQASVFATLDATYVWSMHHDGTHLYAATGGAAGVIYRIDDGGEIETFFTCEDENVTALLMQESGRLLAGTAQKGLVYEISGRDEGMVVYDSKLQEVTAIVEGKNGTCYFAVVGFSQKERPAPAGPPAIPQPKGVGHAEGNAAHLQTPLSLQGPGDVAVSEARIIRPRDTRVPLRGEVMRWTPDRLVRRIYARDKHGILSLAALPDGHILAGTSEKGRILRLDDSGEDALYISTGSGEVTALTALPAKDRVIGATSNPGRIFSLDRRRREKGVYFSEVRDAGNTARWGAMTWRIDESRAAGPGLYARAGNTDAPGREWSAWIGPLTAGDQIDLPPAQYIQWKAVFPASDTGTGDALESVSLSYRQINQKPDIKKIAFLSPGDYFPNMENRGQRGFQSRIDDWIRKRTKTDNTGPPVNKQPDRKAFMQGMRTVVWEATDPNGDVLTFSLKLMPRGRSEGPGLAEALENKYFSFDTRKIPDGEYAVLLSASDGRSNPAAEALTVQRESDLFLVDNTPPDIALKEKAEGGRFQVTISDELSRIRMAEYALNAGPWQVLEAADGLFDTRTERSFIEPEKGAGEQVIVITAMDESGNIRTTTWTID
jgi:hypothetical protein